MEAFGVVAEAEGGVAKLKSLVLSLAVKGKLVHQDQADQSASQLLAHAAEMRSRLISDGLAARGKLPSPPIEEDHLFAVPAGWLWTRIGIISDVAGGLQKSPRRDPKSNHYPYLRVANVQRGFLDLSEIARFELEPDELRRFALQPGDLLVVEGNGSESEIGRCALWDGSIQNCIHQNHIIRCRPLGVTPEFVLLFLNSPYGTKQMKALAVTTSGLYNLSVGKIKDVLVPLPPVVEQQRIVAKVDQLMAMLDDLEQRQEKKRTAAIHVSKASLDSLVNAEDPDQLARAWERVSKSLDMMLGSFGGVNRMRAVLRNLAVNGMLGTTRAKDQPIRELMGAIRARVSLAAEEKMVKILPSAWERPQRKLPNGWEWVRLGDLLVFGPRNGFSPSPVDHETSTKSLTLSATTSGRFDSSCSKFVAFDVPHDSHLWLRPGDVLVQRANTIDYVGVSAIYHGEHNRFIYPDLMMKLRVVDLVDVNFIQLAMSSDDARRYLKARASGTSGSMPKINQATLMSLPLALPPADEQHRIVEVFTQLEAVVDRVAECRRARSRIAAGLVGCLSNLES